VTDQAQVWLVASDGPARDETAQLITAAGLELWQPQVGRGPQLALVGLSSAEPAPAIVAISNLRRGSKELPIVCIVDDHDLDARLAAFRAGADDVVTAPLAPEELHARFKVWVRRGHTDAATLAVDDLVIDEATRTVTRAGSLVPVSSTGFDLLVVLARQPGHNVSREDLRRQIWGESTVEENRLDVHISRLRRALHAAGPPLLHTVYGVGYRLGS
jgi:two-component system, OmpR family, response regulator